MERQAWEFAEVYETIREGSDGTLDTAWTVQYIGTADNMGYEPLPMPLYAFLGHLGRDNWELVTVISDSLPTLYGERQTQRYYFKRPVED